MRRDACQQQGLERLARIEGRLPRRYERVCVGGFEWSLECLDDLDAVIDTLVSGLRPMRQQKRAVSEACPHFGVLWPAAIALCEQLAARGRLSDKHVLELGCGLALPAMLAQRLGAERVVATDRHPLTPYFLQRNAAANGVVGIEYAALDWRQPIPALGRFDLIIGSDLLYEAWQPGFLADLLRQILAPGGDALIVDPGRRYVDAFATLVEAAGFMCELVAIRPIPHGSGTVEALVLEVRSRPGARDP